MTGPDHHAKMEAHYAAGMERQEEQFLFDDALAEAKARVAEEVEREGFPPAAEILLSWGVGAGVRVAVSRLMPEIGDAREELSRLKFEMALSSCEDTSGDKSPTEARDDEAASLDGMAEASRVIASKHLVLGDEIKAAYWRGRARGLQLAAHNLHLSPAIPLTEEEDGSDELR